MRRPIHVGVVISYCNTDYYASETSRSRSCRLIPSLFCEDKLIVCPDILELNIYLSGANPRRQHRLPMVIVDRLRRRHHHRSCGLCCYALLYRLYQYLRKRLQQSISDAQFDDASSSGAY